MTNKTEPVWHDITIFILIVIIIVFLTVIISYYASINDGGAYRYCLWNIEMVNHTITQHDIDWCSGLLS